MPHLAKWTDLHARLHRAIRQRHLLEPRQCLLIAVSGGQDSLCLMQLLIDLQPKWNWHLAIAHCNHRWHPEEDHVAEYVATLAQQRHLPFYSSTSAQIDRREAAARQWRYQELTQIAQNHGYTAVVTAHTMSDRAETVLHNLIRGSGTDGLQALDWQRNLAPRVMLVRPLLDITRAETERFCQSRHLAICVDPFNQDPRYTRSRIRHDLIPHLKAQFNPQIELALHQTAEILRAEADYLSTQADAVFQRAIAPREPPLFEPQESSDEPLNHKLTPPLQINRIVLQTVPLALQRRVMRRCLHAILPSAPNFDHIEKLTALISAPHRTQSDPFPGGAIARVDQDWIIFEDLQQTDINRRS
ncbi:MAG: tRNA lysidine(34) synthetase TilS [Elainellaceae cyanobacterium]